MLSLNGATVPTFEQYRNIPEIFHDGDNYLQFTHSSIENDAAQSTIPYIDAQEVTLEPPMPLSGVGLYYKAKKGSGGFVGAQIMIYDYNEAKELPIDHSGAAPNVIEYIILFLCCVILKLNYLIF